MKVKSLSRVRLLATPWTAAYQAPLPMGFSRQEYWSGVPFPSPWFLSNNKGQQLHLEVIRTTPAPLCTLKSKYLQEAEETKMNKIRRFCVQGVYDQAVETQQKCNSFILPSFRPNIKQKRQDEFGCQPSRLESGLTRRPLALQLWVRSPARGMPASARYKPSRAFTGSSQPGMRRTVKPICPEVGRRRSCPISPSRVGSRSNPSANAGRTCASQSL